MFAVISDIHGNQEALEAVLRDIDKRKIKTVYCLGDVVGYGASPRECLDLVMERTVGCICGNHDQAVLCEPTNFNISAERAIYWTRQLFEDEPKKPLRDRRIDFLGKLPAMLEVDGLLFVHGSPRRPINEYLFAEDVYTNPQKILSNFDKLQQCHKACLVGHTHVPGVFLDDPYFEPPAELPEAFRYSITADEKAIINVGSIGQPRDRDVRASYAVVFTENDPMPEEACSVDEISDAEMIRCPQETTVVEFVRIDYDIEKAVSKILSVPELDDFLGHRLLEGR